MVNKVMKLHVPHKTGSFLSSSATVRFYSMMFIVTAHLARHAMRFRQTAMAGYALLWQDMCCTCIVMAGYVLHVHCYGRICVARALLWQDICCTCIVMAGYVLNVHCCGRICVALHCCGRICVALHFYGRICVALHCCGRICVARALLWQDMCCTCIRSDFKALNYPNECDVTSAVCQVARSLKHDSLLNKATSPVPLMPSNLTNLLCNDTSLLSSTNDKPG